MRSTIFVATLSLCCCAAANAALVCPTPPTVLPVTQPPTAVNGTTVGGPVNVADYTCAVGGPQTGLTGPEVVYELTLTATSVVLLRFCSPNPDLRLLLLRDCDEATCLTDTRCAETLDPGTYRIVVDGLNLAAGDFTVAAVVLPAIPYNYSDQCPTCVGGCAPPPGTPVSTTWQFNDQNYCGTGCDFALFAVADICGASFHVPLYDVETGHMSIRDVLRDTQLDLTADNDIPGCPFSQTGTLISWEDNGCSSIPCPSASCGGGADCRFNAANLDIRTTSPVAPGVFRVDFINMGGFFWDVVANCIGDRTPVFALYRELCPALLADPTPCSFIEGACCTGMSCRSVSRASCDQVGGTYRGDAIPCSPNLCGCAGTVPPLATATRVCEGQPTSFSCGVPEPGALYEWDFEDDGTYDATGCDVLYTYPGPGMHNARVRLTTAAMCTVTAPVVADVSSNTPPSLAALIKGVKAPPSGVHFEWSAITGAASYRVARGDLSSFYSHTVDDPPGIGRCDTAGLTTFDDADDLLPFTDYYYLVAPLAGCGAAGPWGQPGDPTPIPIPTASCP